MKIYLNQDGALVIDGQGDTLVGSLDLTETEGQVIVVNLSIDQEYGSTVFFDLDPSALPPEDLQ